MTEKDSKVRIVAPLPDGESAQTVETKPMTAAEAQVLAATAKAAGAHAKIHKV